MLSNKTIRQVQELLLSGHLSHRQIARDLGLSRSSVDKIAQDRRVEPAATVQLQIMDSPWYDDDAPYTRCPGCGGLVQIPCRLCEVRACEAAELEARRQKRLQARLNVLRQTWIASLSRQSQRDIAERIGPRKAG